MNNFSTVIDNKTYWISRSISVVGMILCVSNDKLYILANKRGKGTPDFQGMWNLPCGYLDYNETTKEAINREVFEETGFNLISTGNDWKLFGINDNPFENKQNVSFMFYSFVDENEMNTPLSYINSELNEVEEIKWINCLELDKYKWAFNHNEIILEFIVNIAKNM